MKEQLGTGALECPRKDSAMFRFSIRELALAMLAAAIGIAWAVECSRVAAERRRLDSTLLEIKRVKADAESRIIEANKAKDSLKAFFLKGIEWREEEAKELERHGLTLYPDSPVCGERPKKTILSKRNPDGTYSELEVYGSCGHVWPTQ
jgi:hypothetical protein